MLLVLVIDPEFKRVLRLLCAIAAKFILIMQWLKHKTLTLTFVVYTQVKDVVGYDALGHCFFTEDGPEERNTFDHCLGLLVKPSTLLPSDRDSRMCKLITEGAYPGYIPKPRQDCR